MPKQLNFKVVKKGAGGAKKAVNKRQSVPKGKITDYFWAPSQQESLVAIQKRCLLSKGCLSDRVLVEDIGQFYLHYDSEDSKNCNESIVYSPAKVRSERLLPLLDDIRTLYSLYNPFDASVPDSGYCNIYVFEYFPIN